MVLTLLVAAPAAMAGTRADIVEDCFEDGDLDGNYTASQIRDARNNLPADVDQYSDCRDVLSRALGGSGTEATGGSFGGGAAPSEPLTPSGPAEEQELQEAIAEGGEEPVQVGDSTVIPGASGFEAGAARSDIPSTLLTALILLGLAAIAAAAPYARRTVVPFVRQRVLRRRLA